MLKQLLIFWVLVMFASLSNAATLSCGDKITSVIVHSGGNVYFTTANVCASHWCILGSSKWDTEEKVNRGLSILMAARAASHDVTIEWDTAEVPTCSTIVDTYATPGFISMK